MAKTPIDSELVRTMAALLDETHLTEIEYDTGNIRIRVARTVQVSGPVAVSHTVAAAAAPVQVAAEDHAAHPGAVTSPMVGVAYLAPEPGAAPFVAIGDIVAEGQTVLLIEAMKTFNPIRATRGGKITRILVSDGTPVEFGEPMMIIE